jgi:hypothetical protein
MSRIFTNPFRPGAGHKPPYLAGREDEKREFAKLLEQDVILQNLVLTGLRGVGKTVLLDEFRAAAIHHKWLWVGTDLSEAASLTEENLATRLLTDLSAQTSSWVIGKSEQVGFGFKPEVTTEEVTLNYQRLRALYDQQPGLVIDKLKGTLEMVWRAIQPVGIVFAYDEAQNLVDHADDHQLPLSVMLDLFQSLQRKNIRFMLALTGLPTLFPKLVESRTYAERMFRVLTLDRLADSESRKAIVRPIEEQKCYVTLTDSLVSEIITESAGYPYFIQFICREVYDVALQKHEAKQPLRVSIPEITRKLDTDFFAGRWARATERQRDLLTVIATIEHCDTEFTVQEIVEQSKLTTRSFSPSHVSQMLLKLADAGLVFKNRHGRYSFAVPLLGRFIRRQRTE